MANALDYLTAAIAYRFYAVTKDFKFPTSIEELKAEIDEYFGINASEDALAAALTELRNLSAIDYFDDPYAGKMVQFRKDVLDTRYRQLVAEDYGVFRGIDRAAGTLYRRALKNPVFWQDIESQINNGAEDIASVVTIPAADRVVTLLHNSPEGQQLFNAVENVVSDLETSNAVASDAGEDRERLIAEGRASIEIIKGERIRWSTAFELVWKFLKEVSLKFKDKLEEWGIEKALSVLDDILELLR